MRTAKVININIKCSDRFLATVEDIKGKEIGSYDGYVPDFFPAFEEQHYGDFVQLSIDLETGEILNWRKPTEEELQCFKEETPEAA